MSAPDQDRLREALRRAADASGTRTPDLDGVLDASRRERRRRRNGILGGTAAVASLVATAGLVSGLAGLAGPAATTADAPVMGSVQELAPQTEGQESGVAPRDEPAAADAALGRLSTLARCGEPIPAATDASAAPLRLTVRPIGAVAAGSTGEAILTLTNTGQDPVEGALGVAPSVAVADQDGTVVATRPDADQSAAGEPVDLAPGESMELSAAIEAVRCTPGRAPTALPRGEYTLSASVTIVPDDAALPALVAVSPLVPLAVD
ncbi:DUF4232 domain-containing protein [Agromyces aerolatus]|uniref:DUF4232 domain-containing protein n=1 Tax=Agromyces sp. LY-1074 TaxID=3074080 RepID=UPI002866A3E2|nr:MULTISPECIES: DUF4232 domain-containing protein [unclassified Agromyces]MDR5701814.1 DUF4232 domain-containing protein [Agromyces sp. LY-1074]MDR5707516.1 DUF4232 domain-containing protein [Agromyces sp. LY-1358]